LVDFSQEDDDESQPVPSQPVADAGFVVHAQGFEAVEPCVGMLDHDAAAVQRGIERAGAVRGRAAAARGAPVRVWGAGTGKRSGGPAVVMFGLNTAGQFLVLLYVRSIGSSLPSFAYIDNIGNPDRVNSG